MGTVIDAGALLHDMVAIRSESGDESEIAELLVERMSAAGIDAHVDPAGNAVGVRRGPPSSDGPTGTGRQLVLLGHMDTVPGDIPVRIEDGVLYGRGSVDAKGPLATFVSAVAQCEPAAGVTLVVVGAVEEEVSSSKGARFAADRYRPEACIIGEPSGWDGVTLGYKGRLLIEYTHEQPCGHGAGPQGAAAERFVDFWNGIAAECAAYNSGREKLFEQLMPALQAIRTTSDGLHDRVAATIGFRLPPDYPTDRLRELAGELTADSRARTRFHGEEVAWSSARTSPLARAFSRAVAAEGGRARFKHKTGTSDMNVLGPVWQCPFVAYGPGDSLLDHTPNEHVELAEVERAVRVLGHTLVHLGYCGG